uniref:Predicted protein n=1 Tax=Hordeum vulgare subsp. vulgare TaxID=112509 RepID=F2CS31_HORVV|nr:predicted protein [Hordeum vulgare subsp. vulgare]
MNGPATATKMNTCTVMKLEVCKYGESGGCGPSNNLCGGMPCAHRPFFTQAQLAHLKSYLQACSNTFWIHIQATSTVLVTKYWPLMVSYHFVASSGALLDPSLNVGCHCCGLNFIEILFLS